MSVTKDKHYIIPLIRNMKNKQIHRIRKQNSGYQGLGVGKKLGLLSNEYRVSDLQDEKSSGDWLHNNVKILNT